jgi:hypothetical protein
MTEVHAILSPNRATQRMLRHRSAVMTLARMQARKSVLLELRAQGLKPQHFSSREIAVLTYYYLNQHRARLMPEVAEALHSQDLLAGACPVQISKVMHRKRMSPNQALRLCRC